MLAYQVWLWTRSTPADALGHAQVDRQRLQGARRPVPRPAPSHGW